MKVKIQREELKRLAGQAATVADGKVQVTLGNVLLTAKGERLHMEATDLYHGVRSSAACQVEEEGTVYVPAKTLKSVVGHLREGEVKLSVDGVRLKLAAGRSRYTLPLAHTDDAPPIPVAPTGRDVPGVDLARVVDAALPAMCTESTRAHLNGVLVELRRTKVRAVATDGHRVHVSEAVLPERMRGDADAREYSTLVPPKGAALLRALDAGDVTLAFDGRVLFATQGATTFSVKVADEAFPPHEKVIPPGAKRKIRIDRQALLSATKSVLSVAAENDGVRITTSPSAVQVECDGADVGHGVEEVPADSADGPLVAMNGRYLIDALSKCSSDEVELWMGEWETPVQVRGEGYISVVMPMRP